MKKVALILVATLALGACKNTADRAGVVEDTRQATIDSMKIEMAKQEAEEKRQRSIDSMKAVADAQAREAAARAQRPVIVNNTTTSAERERKGWSNTAKGAAIGAGVGAITGAAISKKKGEGAIIGGLAGAGVGAGTGAIIDDSKKKKK